VKRPRSKSSLTGPQQRLVELMQQINFGRIEDLLVRNGVPVNPPPRVIRKLKVGADNSPRPEYDFDDFLLRQQTEELLSAVEQMGDGEVLVIDVRHGLPFSLEVEHLPETTGVRRG
jgi:hypothetical protein